MSFILEVFAWVLAVLVGLPSIYLLVQVVASGFVASRDLDDAPTRSGPAPRVVVLVPAHDEATCIRATLEALRRVTGPRERILVVADNCTDGTAAICRELGVDVVERSDRERRGKGYALAFGLDHLAGDPPDVVVVVDADCRAAPGAIARCVRVAMETGRPVQGRYLMSPVAPGSPQSSISAFAVLLRNHVRLLGSMQLGAPCALVGSGMAFPWGVARAVSVGSDNIVEDLQWGLDLSIAGHPPVYAPDACFEASLPPDARAARSQRTRWEHGQLSTLIGQGPRMLLAALSKRRFDLLLQAADLAVPPLSLLAICQLVAAVLLFVLWKTGADQGPLWVLAALTATLLAAVTVAWWRHGREILPLRLLLFLPVYVIGKLPIYAALLLGRERRWVRTARDAGPGGEPTAAGDAELPAVSAAPRRVRGTSTTVR